MRKTIKIPSACRERYVPLGHPLLTAWPQAGIVHAGISELVPGYRIAVPRLERSVIIGTVRGRAWLRDDRRRVALEPGSVAWVGPGGGAEWAIDGADWAMVWWYLDPATPWRRLLAPGLHHQQWGYGEALFHQTAVLLDALVPPVRSTVARSAAAAILAPLREWARGVEAGGDAAAAALEALWRRVEADLHEPWSVERLARELAVAPASFQRLMHRVYGCSAHRLLVERRMATAADLLRHTDYPLKLIASRVGYADAFTFSAAFKRHTGRSPRDFRAEGG